MQEPSTFRVDLRGLVDLLARHVYSSPRVFVRELLQNAVDAVTARRQLDPDAPNGPIRILPADGAGAGAMLISDPGIGLTEDETHRLLATIGASAKRDELDLPRAGFLGRFGVGLLSGFVVAARIEVLTRSTHGGPVVSFVGSEDGSYSVRAVAPGDPAVPAGMWSVLGNDPGTVVRLEPRPGLEGMTEAATLERLARVFGEILPTPVLVRRLDGSEVDVTDPDPPWRRGSGGGLRSAQVAWCERHFDFTPIDVVDLRVPGVGLLGAAFIQPTETHPGLHQGHRVFLRRMLIGEAVEGLVPEWAFFARCVVDAEELHPTASRELLVDDDALAAAREGIGQSLRDWLMRLGSTDPERLARVLAVHRRTAKALAAHDEAVFAALAPWLEMETSQGVMGLAELVRRTPTVRYARTVDRFRQLAPIAQAQGLLIVNAGYAFDADLLARVGRLAPGAVAVELGDGDVVATLDAVDSERLLAAEAFLRVATAATDEAGCRVELRSFEPAHVPALLLHDEEAFRLRELRNAEWSADPVWGDLLRSLDDGGEDGPRLVFNDLHPLIARLVERAGAHDDVVTAAVQALYGQALLLGHHRLRGVDLALLNRALLTFIDLSTSE